MLSCFFYFVSAESISRTKSRCKQVRPVWHPRVRPELSENPGTSVELYFGRPRPRIGRETRVRFHPPFQRCAPSWSTSLSPSGSTTSSADGSGSNRGPSATRRPSTRRSRASGKATRVKVRSATATLPWITTLVRPCTASPEVSTTCCSRIGKSEQPSLGESIESPNVYSPNLFCVIIRDRPHT